MKEIPLTRGMVALIDDEDFERVSPLKWGAIETGKLTKKFYARHATNRGGVFTSTLLHRFILDAPDDVDVDHADGNGLNCQRANIRVATAQQNQWNRGPAANHAIGLKGVHKLRGLNGYRASITHEGMVLRLGKYATPEEAARVHDAAVTRLRGEFAWTNFPDIDPAAAAIVVKVIAGGAPPNLQSLKYKLTDGDVRIIRSRYADGGVLLREIAEEYGVCVAAVGHALRGFTFAHITDPAPLTDDKRRKEPIAA